MLLISPRFSKIVRQQIVGSWNKNLGCYDVLWTGRWNGLLRLFSQIVAGTRLVDKFGFRGLGLVFFIFIFFLITGVVKCGLWAC